MALSDVFGTIRHPKTLPPASGPIDLYSSHSPAAMAKATTKDGVWGTMILSKQGIEAATRLNAFYQQCGSDIIDADGKATIDTDAGHASLEPAAPTPFAETTTLAFTLPLAQPVTLRIFDVRGALVRSLVNEPMPAGSHHASWNGRNENGARVGSGIYYVELRAGQDVLRRRIVFAR